ILSLAGTPAGDAVALISERGQGRYFFKTQLKKTMYREASRLALAEDEEPRLCPNLVGAADRFLGAVLKETQLCFYSGPTLVPLDTLQSADGGPALGFALLVRSLSHGWWSPTALAMYSVGFVYHDGLHAEQVQVGGGWVPGIPPDSR